MADRVTAIRVGPSGLPFVMLTGLIAGAAVYTGSNLLYAGLGLMLGGLGTSCMVALAMLRSVHVERRVPQQGVADEPLVLRYRIENRGRLPTFGLVIHETWGPGARGWKRHGPIAEQPPRLHARPRGWVMHLGPRQTLQGQAVGWPCRRGQLNFERVVVSTSFPFGMLRKERHLAIVHRVLIYPPIYRLHPRVLNAVAQLDPAGGRLTQRGGGQEEFFGLREYRTGESMRFIDWKHSARKGELIAREMTQPAAPRLMILLALQVPQQHADDPAPATLQERAIALAGSLIDHLHARGFRVGLTVTGVAGPTLLPHHSWLHRQKLMAALAELDLSQPAHARHGSREPGVVVCAHEEAAPLSRRGATVLDARRFEHYLASSDSSDTPVRAGAPSPRPIVRAGDKQGP
jgi:uncharacterized protein (DUF58 family)